MKSIAARQAVPEMTLLEGEMKGRSGDDYMIVTDLGMAHASRAVGCLVEPEPGDGVLAALAEDGRAFILTVLTRSGNNRDVRISVEAGSIALEAENISIGPRAGLALSAPDLTVEAERGKARIGALAAEGDSLESRFTSLATIADTMETVSGRVIERIGRLYRRVLEFEESKVSRMRLLVEGLFFLSAKNSSIRSEERIKIDAEKIHLG